MRQSLRKIQAADSLFKGNKARIQMRRAGLANLSAQRAGLHISCP
jgi:hypothetical protein